MQNAKPNLVRLNEEYTVDLNRVVYVKKDEWKSTWDGKTWDGKNTKYHKITIFFDVSCGNNCSIDIYSSKKDINRILDLITQK